MITKEQISALLQELIDDETRQEWEGYSGLYAMISLGLKLPRNEPLKALNEPLIASARAAKAKGIPLWKWADDKSNPKP